MRKRVPDYWAITEYVYVSPETYADVNSFRNYTELIPIIKYYHQLYSENKLSFNRESLYFFITKNSDANVPYYSLYRGQKTYPDHNTKPLDLRAFYLEQMQQEEAKATENRKHLKDISSGCPVESKKYQEATNLPANVVNATPCIMMKGY